MRRGFRLGALILALLGAVRLPAASSDWLLAAAAAPVPANPDRAPAVVLLNETILDIDDRGRLTETHRVALRILDHTGRKHATGFLFYNGASAEILGAEAWVVRAGEIVETRGRSRWVDEASNSPGAAVDEKRTSSIDLTEQAVAGDVMGYETRLRTPLIVAQLCWYFGDRLPQVKERVSLVLPAGFEVTHESHGGRQPVLTRPNGNTWDWSLADQPYRPDETAAPDSGWMNAELFVRIQPPASAVNFKLQRFSSWADVTAFTERLNEGQCDNNPLLAGKARELTAGESTPLGKIGRIADYLQHTRYVGIYRGLRYGYGWKARKASEVLATGYGDCKDKANLMMALLREVGINSHRVTARLDRERRVRNEFPSLIQFDHAILAIEVPETVDLPAVVPLAGVGRLLFFDPTDKYTALGDLSLDLQDGYVHVNAPGVDQLTRLPEFSAEKDFRVDRRLDLTITAEGTLTARGTVMGLGQKGASLRHQLEQSATPIDLEKLVTQQLAGGLKAAVVTEAKGVDDRAAGRSGLSFGCSQPRYLQQNSGQSAVLKLDVLSRQHLPNLSAATRHLPVDLLPLDLHDQLDLTLPAGYEVEEAPRRAEVTSDYGHFLLEYEQRAGGFVLRRQLTLNKRLVPVDDYAKLRQFLASVSRADRSTVLLKMNP